MSNEPDPSFSGNAGGLNPPGTYCYPVGFGGSTKNRLVCINIPYPYVPGATPKDTNPGTLPDELQETTEEGSTS